MSLLRSSSGSYRSCSSSIQKLLDFLKLSSRLEGTTPPGFSTAGLGLSYDGISQRMDLLSFDASSNTLKLRFPLKELPMRRRTSSSSSYTTSDEVALSTYLAMMDDITTWALVLADTERGRAGKSVCLQASWNPAVRQQQQQDQVMASLQEEEEAVVEFTATVKKIGRNIGFVGAEIRDVATNQVVCYGSHVKYMPMGVVTDFMLSSKGWGLTKLYSEHVLSVRTPPMVLTKDPVDSIIQTTTTATDHNLMDSFRVHNATKNNAGPTFAASFTPSKEHASLGGPIHGGCQAVLMEMAANAYYNTSRIAHNNNNPHDQKPSELRLDSISVDYMSPPKSKVVHLNVHDDDCYQHSAASCEANGDNNNNESSQLSLLQQQKSLLRVQLKGDDDRVKSEGLLHFSRR